MATVPPCPPRECPQCWTHAYDRSIHAALPRGARQCDACVQCRNAGHPPRR